MQQLEYYSFNRTFVLKPSCFVIGNAETPTQIMQTVCVEKFGYAQSHSSGSPYHPERWIFYFDEQSQYDEFTSKMIEYSILAANQCIEL